MKLKFSPDKLTKIVKIFSEKFALHIYTCCNIYIYVYILDDFCTILIHSLCGLAYCLNYFKFLAKQTTTVVVKTT